MQSSCRIRTDKWFHRAVSNTGSGKWVLSLTKYNFIANNLKTSLLPAPKTLLLQSIEFIANATTLIVLKLGKQGMHTLIVAEKLKAAIMIDFDTITLLTPLYRDIKNKGYLNNNNVRIKLEFKDYITSQVRLLSDSVISSYVRFGLIFTEIQLIFFILLGLTKY